MWQSNRAQARLHTQQVLCPPLPPPLLLVASVQCTSCVRCVNCLHPMAWSRAGRPVCGGLLHVRGGIPPTESVQGALARRLRHAPHDMAARPSGAPVRGAPCKGMRHAHCVGMQQLLAHMRLCSWPLPVYSARCCPAGGATRTRPAAWCEGKRMRPRRVLRIKPNSFQSFHSNCRSCWMPTASS